MVTYEITLRETASSNAGAPGKIEGKRERESLLL